jgi:thymidylate kinase
MPQETDSVTIALSPVAGAAAEASPVPTHSRGHQAEADRERFRRCALESLLHTFEERKIVYAILGDPSRLPLIATDLDVAVDRPERAVEAVRALCRSESMVLANLHWHATGLRCDLAAARDDGVVLHFPGPDLITRLPDGSRTAGALSWRAMLAERRRSEHGFWVPAPGDAFVYAVLKAARFGRPLAHIHPYLSALWQQAPEAIGRAIAAAWPEPSAMMVLGATRGGDWNALSARASSLLRQAGLCRRRVLGMGMRRLWWRVTRPSGLSVAVLGPDGAGKSMLVKRLAEELGPVFRGVQRFHLTPTRPVAEADATAGARPPHMRPPRGALGSLLKLAWLAGEFRIGHLVRVWPARLRDRLVLFDRYYHDLMVDPRRYRHGGPMWLARLVARLVPRPDLFLLLDLPADVALTRKQEVDREEALRQEAAFRAVVGRLANHAVIDAAQPPDAVAGQAAKAILAYLGERMERRIEARPGP